SERSTDKASTSQPGQQQQFPPADRSSRVIYRQRIAASGGQRVTFADQRTAGRMSDLSRRVETEAHPKGLPVASAVLETNAARFRHDCLDLEGARILIEQLQRPVRAQRTPSFEPAAFAAVH